MTAESASGYPRLEDEPKLGGIGCIIGGATYITEALDVHYCYANKSDTGKGFQASDEQVEQVPT